MSDECLFCKIASGDIPAHLVYQDDKVIAFRDIHPAAPVHLLIIPREHVANLTALTSDHTDLIGYMMHIAAKLASVEGIAERGYRVVTNVNEDGGQSVMHLHLHLLGGRSMTWPPG